MRAVRLFVIVAVAGAILAAPSLAQAGGGAFIEVRRVGGKPAHHRVFLPGEHLVASTQLWLKRGAATRAISDGPVVAYLVTERVSLIAGRPIPVSAISLGTFTFRHRSGHTWLASVQFTLPSLPSGSYSIEPCNDPCTLVGFGQYARGWFDVVQTDEARALLIKTYRQHQQVSVLRREYRKAVKESESTKLELQASVDHGIEASTFAVTQTLRAQAAEKDAAAARANARAANVRAAWLAGLAAICLMAAVILAIVRRPSRRIRVPVPGSPAELVELSERR